MEKRLTDEQQHAVQLSVKNHGDVKIEAFAGTGKTTTLKAIGHAMPNKKGIYLAFNKSIADEAARTFPGNVQCKTAHSLAFRSVGSQYKERLGQRLTAYAIAKELGIGHWNSFQNTTLCMLAQQTVARFCHSDADEISHWQVPRDAIEKFESKPGIDVSSLKEYVVKIAQKLWKVMENPKSSMPVTHDFYLKKWALTRPRLHLDFVMLDEAQDANGLLLRVLRDAGAPIVFVGDKYQQIYSWRGAVNAMENFEAGSIAKLTQSFRFGDAIARAANEILVELGSDIKIRGNPAVKSQIHTVKNPCAILCRTNAETVSQLISAISRGKKPALQGGVREISALIKGMDDIQNGLTPTHPELILFSDWDQVLAYSETEMGQDLESVINLMESFGAKALLKVFDEVSVNTEASSDLIISTVHKAKGREWSSVQLGSDFRGPEDRGYRQEEGNLAYVAVTRAIESLDITDFDVISQIRSKRAEEKSLAGTLDGRPSEIMHENH